MGHGLRAIALLTAFSLSACGGGGGGGNSSSRVPNAAVGGLWFGTVSPVNEIADEVTGVIAEDGRAYFLDEWDRMYWGSVSSAGNAITAHLTVADIFGYSLWDDSYSAALTLNGTAQARKTLTGNWELTTTNKGYKSGKLDLAYDELYEEDSSLAKIAGNYQDFYGYDGDVFNIAANGDIFKQFSYGSCVINGRVSIINSAYNAYDVLFDYNGCAPDSSYYGAKFRGVAVIVHSVDHTQDAVLVFAHRLNGTQPEPLFLPLLAR
jgi:hypothetical protein